MQRRALDQEAGSGLSARQVVQLERRPSQDLRRIDPQIPEMPTSCLDPGPVKTRQKRLLEDRQCPQHMVKRLADIAAPARRADQLLRIEHVDPRVLRQPQEQSPSRAEDICT
jgi:hypothetical protein